MMQAHKMALSHSIELEIMKDKRELFKAFQGYDSDRNAFR